SSPTSRRTLIAVALIGFAVGVAVSIRLDVFPRSEAISIFGQGDQQQTGGGSAGPPPTVALPDFAELAEHVAPSVVNVSTTQEVKGSSRLTPGPGGPGGPGSPGG